MTIDVPWLTVRPWYTITSIESHKTWGGAWTRIPYIGRASVDRVVWWSPMSMWTGKERKWSHPKPACINMSWGLCALGPLQPRWFAISPKRSINGRTWQAANVSGLMHDGETEGLKQRCVHQQVSDSSGWLMLMHFIFKFNCPPRLPRSILIWAPPQSWPYLQHRCERRKIFQPVSRILILEIHNAVVAVPANVTPGPWLQLQHFGDLSWWAIICSFMMSDKQAWI